MTTVRIPLTQGKIAIIDEEDYPLICQHKWRAFKDLNTWYAVTGKHSCDNAHPFALMHRMILGTARNTVVDHKDGDGLNNRRENIRECSLQQNARNRTHLDAKNRTGYRGVAARGNGHHRVYVNKIYLGRWKDPMIGALAHDCVARFLDPFYQLNFPNITEYPWRAQDLMPGVFDGHRAASGDTIKADVTPTPTP